jgi:hypothetical protein
MAKDGKEEFKKIGKGSLRLFINASNMTLASISETPPMPQTKRAKVFDFRIAHCDEYKNVIGKSSCCF